MILLKRALTTCILCIALTRDLRGYAANALPTLMVSDLQVDARNKGVDSASASYQSVVGLISSGWRREASSLIVDVVIPPNVQATISLNASSLLAVTMNGRPVAGQGCDFENAKIRCVVGSGKYHLVEDIGAKNAGTMAGDSRAAAFRLQESMER